jgi:hypothetical protein
MSSFPTMVADDQNRIFVIWSGVTNFRDPGNYMLRHIYARVSSDLGATWQDTITELTGGPAYNFTECVYPAAAPLSTDDNIFLVFQRDTEAGAYVWGLNGHQGQQAPIDSQLIFLSPVKSGMITVFNEEIIAPPDFFVSQNAPNPVNGNTCIQVKLECQASLSIEIYSTMGQKVMEQQKGKVGKGAWQFVVDASGLKPGIYLYTVKAGSQQVTKKMIVQ